MRGIDMFRQEIFSACIALLFFSCDLEKIPDVVEPQIIDFSPKAGRSGDLITIQGAYFGEDITKIQVQINDVEAEITTPPSDGNLKVRVPRGAGSGDISIAVGQSKKASKEGFIYMLSAEVSTFAGSGESGFQDGNAETAKFAVPYGLAVDNQDNIYVGDLSNHSIRKITPEGDVTTIAGTGLPGLINGEGHQAAFMRPAGLDMDKNGNLVVADYDNHTIRKIALGGSNIVSSVAGTIDFGFKNDRGSEAQFHNPVGIAVDKDDNILVADRRNYVIRSISPAEFVTTYAGDGLEGDLEGYRLSARFNAPEDFTIDNSGNIYLTAIYNHKIKLITPQGSVTTVAGNGASGNINGPGTTAQFYSPVGIDSDDKGNLYVADSNNNKVRIVTTGGFTYDLAGDGYCGYKDGPGLQAKISQPLGLVLDSKGNVYVACSGNYVPCPGKNNIRKIVVF